jgi:hypothetical protein
LQLVKIRTNQWKKLKKVGMITDALKNEDSLIIHTMNYLSNLLINVKAILTTQNNDAKQFYKTVAAPQR